MLLKEQIANDLGLHGIFYYNTKTLQSRFSSELSHISFLASHSAVIFARGSEKGDVWPLIWATESAQVVVLQAFPANNKLHLLQKRVDLFNASGFFQFFLVRRIEYLPLVCKDA